MLFAGIDPGSSGATAFISEEGEIRFVTHKETYHDISETIRDAWIAHKELFAVIEQVHAMPGQGVTSMFTFGQSYGFLLGLLTALKIPYEKVTPGVWQKFYSLPTTKAVGSKTAKKNLHKAKAQELFPDVKITHANADAILIAEFCRRTKQ